MSLARAVLLPVAGVFVLAACAAPTPNEVDIADRIETSVAGTVEVLDSDSPTTAAPASTPTPVPIPTSTPAPTASPTPTSLPPMASVSLATNCRTGPGLAYPIALSFEPGQVARVIARSAEEGYWYIARPDQGDEPCWIWGEYATLEGDTSSLPVLTAEPPPVPQLDFTLYRHSFSECGSKRVSFIVVNTGATTFRSARIHIKDLDTSEDLNSPRLDLHPFADNPSSCPADKGSNSLPPGATAYIVVPLSEFEGGHDAVANIRLCTGDEGGGDCVLKSAFFRLPQD